MTTTAEREPVIRRGWYRRFFPVGSKAETVLLRLIMLGIFIGLWQAAHRRWPIEVPSLVEVMERCWLWIRDGTLSANLWVTVQEVLLGFSIALVVGIIIGWVLAQVRVLDVATRPFIDVFNSIPRIGLAPIFILWFGLGMSSRVILVFSVVQFVILVATYSGVKSVDPEYVLLARSLGASRLGVARKITFPAILPWLFAAMRLGAAYAISAAVVGEFIAADRGLGYLLFYRAALLDFTGTMATLVFLAGLAFIFTYSISLIERRALRWRTVGMAATAGEAAAPTAAPGVV